MRRYRPLIIVAAAIACISSVATLAVGQSRDALGIADNDSVYIDAKSFKIVPGKAEGDASTLIKTLDARNLGPGTIVFRVGDQLYIADASPVIQNRLGLTDRYGSDRYGSDRYGSDRYGSDRYGSDRYGSDRYGSEPAQQRVYINDPEYAQYKLKKDFEDNWTAGDSK
jgi:hypothetical protein